MRITSSDNIVKVPEPKTNKGSTKPMNSGDVFRAKIIAIHTEAILLKLSDGSNLRAQVMNAERFVKGESMDFCVLENYNKGEALSEILSVEVLGGKNNSEILNSMKVLFETAGLQTTSENVKAYQVLAGLDIEITKDNIVELTTNSKYVNKISDAFLTLGGDLSKAVTENKDSNLTVKDAINFKDNIIAEKVLDKFAEFINIKDGVELKNMTLKEVVIKILENPVKIDPLLNQKIMLDSSNEEGIVNKDVMNKEVVIDKNFNTSTLTKGSADYEKINNEIESIIKSVVGVLISDNKPVLQDSMDKLGFLMKSSKPFTIMNMSTVDKLVFEESLISDQLKDLDLKLNKHLLTNELRTLLKGFNFDNFKTEQGVKQYFSEIVNELRNIDQSTLSDAVKADVKSVVESISFLEQNTNNVTWMQIPIDFNDSQKNLDVFIKNDTKGSKKVTKNGTKILVALNTEYLDLFQALIHIENQVLNIDLKLKYDHIKKMVEKSVPQLEKILEIEGFHKVIIKTHTGERVSFSEFLVEGTHSGHINIKV